MFLEPTKTPCCQRTYCNDCISNALIESDFVCPGCSTEGVLLDNLTPDEEAASKIKAYEAEKAEARKEKEKMPASQDGVPANGTLDHDELKEANSKERSPSHQETTDADTSAQSKKRSAEDDPLPEVDGEKSGNATKKQKGQDESNPPGTESNPTEALAGTSMPFNPQMPFGGFGMMPPFSESAFNSDPMGFMNPMAMANGFPNPMGPGWNPMNMPFNPLQAGMYGDQSNGFPNMFNGDPSMSMFPMAQMAGQMPNPGFQGQGINNFSNQQRTAFGGPYTREEDSPYFRQPVNPQRHQARNRRVRPSDYREL
jgi:protein MPE1